MTASIHDVIFDCDSTLSTIEGIDELAQRSGNFDRVAAMTRAAMNGDIALERVYDARLNIIRPSLADVVAIGALYSETVVADARMVITSLLEKGKRLFVVSGGILQAVSPFALSLGFEEEHIHAVQLLFDRHGCYAGFAASPLVTSLGKREVIRALRTPGRRAMLVGDGTSDLAAKDEVDVFVGFGGVVARTEVRAHAHVFLNGPSLKPILELVG